MQNACGYTPSVGTQLQRADETGGGTVWETIGGIITMPTLQITAGTAQCNDFDNSVDGFAEYYKNNKFTFADLTFDLGLIEDNPVHEKLEADVMQVGDKATGEKERVGFRLLVPTENVRTYEFRALVIDWSLVIPDSNADDNKLTTPIILKPSGGLTRIT